MRFDKSKTDLTGTFNVPPALSLFGVLSLDGQNTSLYLRDEHPFFIEPTSQIIITGILDDGTEVSLIDCSVNVSQGSSGSRENPIWHSTLSPSFIVIGNCNFPIQDRFISSISFVLEDWETLFYDIGAFGKAWDQQEILQNLIRSKNLDHPIPITKDHLIYYFTGKWEIFSTDTVLGQISAFHSLRERRPTPRGFQIDNYVAIQLRFKGQVDFRSAIQSMLYSQQFFEIVVGRVQDFFDVRVCLVDQDPQSCEVYNCTGRKHRRSNPDHDRVFQSLLVDAVQDRDQFESILSRWIARHLDWSEARSSLLIGWREPRYYGRDRIVRAANMFDLLPDDTYPNRKDIPESLISAVGKTKKDFKKLPESLERNSILFALGRIKQLTLKEKVRHRARIIIRQFGKYIPDICLACDEAVNCRNRYVHGTLSKINYEEHPWTQVFLTDTLEFVFAASDMIECGWDMSRWYDSDRKSAHPFGLYLCTYARDLGKLKQQLER